MNDEAKKYSLAMVALTVLIAVGAGFGAVSAAPGSIDSDGNGGTATDAWISDGATVDAEFNASGDETYGLAVNQSGVTSPTASDDMEMNVTHDGDEYFHFSGEWDTYDADSSGTADSLVTNFTDDELADVPVNPNQNMTLTVNYWNASADNPSPTNATVYVETTGERYVRNAMDGAEFVTLNSEEPPLYKLWQSNYDATTVDEEAAINGSNTTVIYNLASDDVSDTFDTGLGEISSAGSFTFMQADVGGNNVPMFYQEAPDSFNDSGTYALYQPGEGQVEFHPGEDYEGEESMDVMASSDIYRITDLGTVWDLGGGDAIIDMVM